MAVFSVVYVAICEFIFAVAFAIVMLSPGIPGSPSTRSALLTAAMSLALLAVAIGLVVGHRWAWYSSWVVGTAVVGLSVYLISSASASQQFNDSAEVGVIGAALLLFTLPGFALLALESTRNYVAKANL